MERANHAPQKQTAPKNEKNQKVFITRQPPVAFCVSFLAISLRPVSTPYRRFSLKIQAARLKCCAGYQRAKQCLPENLKCGREPQETCNQCGLKVFPVSISVFKRDNIRGHPSALEAYPGSSSAHPSWVTTTLVASVSATSSNVTRDAFSL